MPNLMWYDGFCIHEKRIKNSDFLTSVFPNWVSYQLIPTSKVSSSWELAHGYCKSSEASHLFFFFFIFQTSARATSQGAEDTLGEMAVHPYLHTGD